MTGVGIVAINAETVADESCSVEGAELEIVAFGENASDILFID